MPVQTRRSLCQKRKAVEDGAVRREHCTIDEQCAICHESLHSSQVYHLPCGHSFHTGCIERQVQAGQDWSNLCALCRRSLEFDALKHHAAIVHHESLWTICILSNLKIKIIELDVYLNQIHVQVTENLFFNKKLTSNFP